jgi:hypothetical protein
MDDGWRLVIEMKKALFQQGNFLDKDRIMTIGRKCVNSDQFVQKREMELL